MDVCDMHTQHSGKIIRKIWIDVCINRFPIHVRAGILPLSFYRHVFVRFTLLSAIVFTYFARSLSFERKLLRSHQSRNKNIQRTYTFAFYWNKPSYWVSQVKFLPDSRACNCVCITYVCLLFFKLKISFYKFPSHDVENATACISILNQKYVTNKIVRVWRRREKKIIWFCNACQRNAWPHTHTHIKCLCSPRYSIVACERSEQGAERNVEIQTERASELTHRTRH